MTTSTDTRPGLAPAHDDLFAMDDDRKDANERRAKAAGLEPCTHCGRGVAPGKGWMTVVVHGGSSVLHPDEVTPEDEADGGYMGAWVLGPTCGRKMVAAAARKQWEGWAA